jgi:uncharacterized membrane protein YidH (DUF202 family)
MPPKKSKPSESRKPVSADIVYQEMYEEMRRFRDYELTSSNWYTAILLALTGVILTIKNTDGESSISVLLAQNSLLKFGLSFLALILVTSGIFTALYASSRYYSIREWVNENLEPTWKNFNPPVKRIKPIHAIVFVQIVLAIIVIVTLWIP